MTTPPRSQLGALDVDLTLAGAAALICTAVVVAVPVTAVRAVFAVPLCLILPGYAFVASAFARARPSWLVRLMLIPAMSLVTLVLAALLLDVVPTGLNETTWAVLLVVIVLGECLVAAMRRSRTVSAQGAMTPGAAHSPERGGRPDQGRRRRSGTLTRTGGAAAGTPGLPASSRLRSWASGVSPWQVLMLAVAALLASGALILATTPLAAPNAIGYTQLWMFSTGTPSAPQVSLGLRCDEQHPTSYRVVVSTGSGAPTVVAGNLRLRPGSGRVYNVPLTNVPGPESLVTVRLYRVGRSAVYRQVTALIPSTLPARTTHHPSSGGAASGRTSGRSVSRSAKSRTTRGGHASAGQSSTRSKA